MDVRIKSDINVYKALSPMPDIPEAQGTVTMMMKKNEEKNNRIHQLKKKKKLVIFRSLQQNSC